MKTVMRVGGGGVAVKSERDNRDAVEQLLGQSLLSSAALTSVSPDYTTLFPYCILLQLNISMSVFLLHTLHVYLISLKDISLAHMICLMALSILI